LYESGVNSVAANHLAASCFVARKRFDFTRLTISHGLPMSATATSPLYREAGGRMWCCNTVGPLYTVGPLHKSHLKARIGRLPSTTWPAIEAGLCRVLGIRVD